VSSRPDQIERVRRGVSGPRPGHTDTRTCVRSQRLKGGLKTRERDTSCLSGVDAAVVFGTTVSFQAGVRIFRVQLGQGSGLGHPQSWQRRVRTVRKLQHADRAIRISMEIHVSKLRPPSIFTRRVLLLSALSSVPTVAFAQDPCARYYGQGYCTDYVNSRISQRQRGDAGSWPSNMPNTAVEAGDVAIFRRINHVAYVENVVRRNADGQAMTVGISEMNFSSTRDPNAPRSCLVTSNFGVRTTRTISVNDAVFMRPGGYRPTTPPRRRYG